MPCGTSGWQHFTGYSGAYLSDGTYMEGIWSNDPSLYRRLFYNVTQSLSADYMTRNTLRYVEVAAPFLDDQLRDTK